MGDFLGKFGPVVGEGNPFSPSSWDANSKDSKTVASPNLPEGLQGLTDQTASRWSALQGALWDQMMPGIDGDPVQTADGGGGGGYIDGGEDNTPPWMRYKPPREAHRNNPFMDEGPDRPGNDMDYRQKSGVVGYDNSQSTINGPPTGDTAGTKLGIPPGATGLGAPPTGAAPGTINDAPAWFGLPNANPEFQPGGGDISDTPDATGWLDGGSQWQDPAQGLLGDASRQIAGGNALLDSAASKALTMDNIPREYLEAYGLLDELKGLSGQKVTGEGLQDDAAFKASEQAFMDSIMPQIESQAALSGLGRSTAMNNATSAQKAQTLLPSIQDFFGREERGIDRQLAQLNQNYGNLIQQGDASYGRKVDAIGTQSALGDYGRGVQQDRNDAGYNDWLRRAGLFENAMGGPAGLLPSTIGSTSETEGKK